MQENNTAFKNKAKKKRAWKSENLSCVFTVRATEEEGLAVKQMAEQVGLSVSRLVIEATLDAEVKTADDARLERECFEHLIFELRRVGVNLNQIAKELHLTRRKSDRTLIETQAENTLREIENVIAKLRKKL